MKNIIFFGDSIIFKTEFPKIICDHYSAVPNDFTYPEATISGVNRSVVKYLVEYPIDDCFFLIGWPSPMRLEFREDPDENDDNNKYFFNDPNYFTFTEKKYIKQPDIRYNRLHRFNSILFEKHLINGKWAATSYGLIDTIKAYDVPFLMFNIHEPIRFNVLIKNTLKNMDKKFYHDPIEKKGTFIYNINKDANSWTKKIIKRMDAVK